MKILCISDLQNGTNHSSVRGIFGSYINDFSSCDTVYFSKSSTKKLGEHTVIIPYRYKRKNFIQTISELLDLNNYDFVIVRNYFPILKQLLKQQSKFRFKIGFWESFPHSYRRLHESQQTTKSKFRKTIEYAIKNKIENALLSQIDFYLPITNKYKQIFRNNIKCPVMPLPMGVDFTNIPQSNTVNNDNITRFTYIGTVDKLRMIDEVISAFTSIKEDYIFDIYTASKNETVSSISNLNDKRIRVYDSLPRDKLFRKITQYDVGIGIIPNNKLYTVSSPTKTLEYYALGIPSIINDIPDYNGLFNKENALICDLSKDSIANAARKAIHKPKTELKHMGNLGKAQVIKHRDYHVMTKSLLRFLDSL